MGDEAAIWLERHGTSCKPTAKNAHAAIVERHHQVLRDTIHKIKDQADQEGLMLPIDDIVAEAVLSKNAFTKVGDFSPYQAVLGRTPQFLSELDSPTISSLDDETGAVLGANRHAVRLREIAISSMVASTSKARLDLALRSNTRPASELHEFQSGELCDIYRIPTRKDLSGWRGPCVIIAVREGSIDVKWGGKVLVCRPVARIWPLHFSL